MQIVLCLEYLSYAVQCMRNELFHLKSEVPAIYSRAAALESIFISFCYEKKSGLIYMLITKVNKKVKLLILAVKINDLKSVCVCWWWWGLRWIVFFLKQQLMSVCSGRVQTTKSKEIFYFFSICNMVVSV